MNSLQFKRATKAQSKLRLCLVGPPGSGKTYTALSIARYLGSNIAVIDTERGSASKYSDEFVFDALDLALLLILRQ
jgi:SpoVK/Ycf46/Vps4 family AAA+-type ATPase